MKSTKSKRSAKKRGRPATGQDPVTAIRLSPDLRAAVDRWAARQANTPSRSEAIRQLIEQGLASPANRARKAASKASEMAGRELDRIGDKSASGEERERRKRRLMKGPTEFREMRDDLPNEKE